MGLRTKLSASLSLILGGMKISSGFENNSTSINKSFNRTTSSATVSTSHNLSYDNMVKLDSDLNPSLHKHNVKDNIDTKLLVARTFTKKDLDVLLSSFEKWSQIPPCSEQSNAGLLLYFSGILSDFPHIEAELKKI